MTSGVLYMALHFTNLMVKFRLYNVHKSSFSDSVSVVGKSITINRRVVAMIKPCVTEGINSWFLQTGKTLTASHLWKNHRILAKSQPYINCICCLYIFILDFILQLEGGGEERKSTRAADMVLNLIKV